MKRYRRLRRLQPDAELLRRRAAGESFRELAPDYGVSYTTLSRYCARPQVARQLKRALQLLRAERPATSGKRHRRLRRLQADAELLRRRAAGESFRALAPTYGVAHTTLSRYFARPEVVKQLKRAVRAERPAAASGKRSRRLRRLQADAELLRRRAAGESFRALAPTYGVAHTTLSRYFARPEGVQALRAERRLERELRSKVRQQAATERERVRDAELAAARLGERRSRPRAGGTDAALLDAHDARLPLSRADLHSRNDLTAAGTVAAGGGLQAVIEATGLRTRENVLELIDPTILEQAFRNDAAAKSSRGPRRRRPR